MSAVKQFHDEDQAKTLYQQLRSEESIDETRPSYTSLDRQIQVGVKFTHRLARECSESEFVNFIVEGEMPAIQLTTEEAELAKGGGLSWDKLKEMLGPYGTVIKSVIQITVACPDIDFSISSGIDTSK